MADKFESRFSKVVPSPVMGPGHISSTPKDELIGQKPTSTLFSIFDPLRNKIKESNQSNNESLSNFLKYDINLIPTKQEINDYLDQVDEIKTRTEKLVKRLK